MRLLKFITGLLLLPACVVMARTVHRLMGVMTEASLDAGAGELTWLAAGFLLWLLIYFTMSLPVRTYVLGHELTHALWAYLTGGRVTGFRIGADDGHVEVTNANFLVMLAPYFFPLYSVLVVLAYGVAVIFVDLTRWQPVWLGLMGLTYSFHVTFTLLALSQRQTDVTENGHIFSYAVIVLMNLLLVAMAMVAAASPTLAQFVAFVAAEGAAVGGWIAGLLAPAPG